MKHNRGLLSHWAMLAVAASYFVWSGTGNAANITYANPAGAQNFTVGANWVGGLAPGAADVPVIDGVNGLTDYPYIDSAVTVQRFSIAAGTSAATGGLEIRSGGTMTNTVNNLQYVGARGAGYLRLQPGGALSVTGQMHVGWGDAAGHGNGTVNQTGGSFTGASTLTLGNLGADANGPTSVGSYTLDAGTFNLTGQLVVGMAGIGTFNMNGGNATINSFLQIGRTGTGTFTQTAGSLTVSRSSGDVIVIAPFAGASGTYAISGGSFTASTSSGGVTNGVAAGTANGTFKVIGNAATLVSLGNNYTQFNGAHLAFDIGSGITPVNVTVNATLAGFLDVVFTAIPSLGQQFTLMNYGGTLTGTFSTFDSLVNSPLGTDTIGLSIDYGAGANSAIKITVTSVPEPTGMCLAAISATLLLLLQGRALGLSFRDIATITA
jgi:hypothetical protein